MNRRRIVATVLNSNVAVPLPLDSYTPRAAFSTSRRLLKSYTGALVKLRNSNDASELDIGYDANGDLDVAAAAVFLNGYIGYGRTVYDQAGVYHAANATAGTQPAYTADGVSGRPAVVYNDAANTLLIIPNTLFLGLSAITLFVVTQMDADALKTASAPISFEADDQRYCTIEQLSGAGNVTGAIRVRLGGDAAFAQSSGTYNWGDPHVVTVRGSNGNPIRIWVDGTEVAYSDQGNMVSIPASVTDGAHGAFGQNSNLLTTLDYEGKVPEAVMFGSALSDADKAAIEAILGAYY